MGGVRFMSYLLISGRTTDQARGMHLGKHTDFYHEAVSMLEMNALDMESEALNDGDSVVISSQWGEAEGRVKATDIPRGMVFIPMGPVANAVSGSDTEGTGMPLFKGFSVGVKKGKSDGTGE